MPPNLRPPFPTNPANGLKTVHVKAAPQDAAPAEGSVGWVAVLSHGYFGISASESDLDGVGADPKKRDFLRAYSHRRLGNAVSMSVVRWNASRDPVRRHGFTQVEGRYHQNKAGDVAVDRPVQPGSSMHRWLRCELEI